MSEKRALKADAKKAIATVQEVLRRWDPIGVIPLLAENELPPNEYDDYAPHIIGMLQRGCSLEDLTAHLERCRTGAMGLPPNRGADRRFAAEIMKACESVV